MRHLGGRAVAEHAHGAVVDLVDDLPDLLCHVHPDLAAFGQIPADHAVAVLVASPLPAGVRVGEVRGHAQPVAQPFVVGELGAVVVRDADARAGRQRREHVQLRPIFAGVLLGLVSGYYGGWVDRILVMIADAVYSFPSLLLAILMAIMISHGQSGLWSGILASGISITVVYIPQYFRTIRAEVIRIKESAYVESARVVGASTWRIMTKHLFKNSTRTLPVILTLNSSEAILTLAGLGFLGFGIEPTAAAEWGYDLNRSVSDVTAGIWWTAVFPGIAIVLIVLGITLVGESLNDLADPRLRARKSAGEVVGSIEDTSVDPNEKPTARNEVIAELDANVDPPATVTDHDPTIVASEWTGEGKPEGKE